MTKGMMVSWNQMGSVPGWTSAARSNAHRQ